MIKQDRINELFREKEDAKSKRRALFLTVIIFTALAITFTILGFTTPLPLPDEAGHFVLVGQDETGMPAEPKPVQEPPAQPKPQEKPESEEPVEEIEDPVEPEMETGGEEEAPEIKPNTEPDPETTEPETGPTPDPEVESEEETKEDNPFLYPGSSGTKNEKGEEGEEDGKEDGLAKGMSYKKTSFGSASAIGGSGRSLEHIEEIDDNSQENADVYIKVTIDSDGNVIEARADYSKSTTTNNVLIQKALNSAKKSKFNKASDGAEITTDILKYEYRLE